MPQILMLVHASNVNRDRFEREYGDDKDKKREYTLDKPVTEMTTDEYKAYVSGFGMV